MNQANITQKTRRLLEQDRIWCAYALADLYRPHADYATWLPAEHALLLHYRGLEPPVLFAYGIATEVRDLLNQVPPGRYQYSLKGSHLEPLKRRLSFETKRRMRRMVLDPDRFSRPATGEGMVPLGPEDLPEILALFGQHPDRPDAFHRRQLMDAAFGIRRKGHLLCFAGTHVVSSQAGVAALGNVFTRPEYRGGGLARRCSAAVVAALLERSISTIVLNVSPQNKPAVRCYRKLGFIPHCDYYEGMAKLIPRSK